MMLERAEDDDSEYRRGEALLYAWGEYDFRHVFGYPSVSTSIAGGGHAETAPRRLTRPEMDADKMGRAYAVHFVLLGVPETIQRVAAARYRMRCKSNREIEHETGIDRKAVGHLIEFLVRHVAKQIGP